MRCFSSTTLLAAHHAMKGCLTEPAFSFRCVISHAHGGPLLLDDYMLLQKFLTDTAIVNKRRTYDADSNYGSWQGN